MTFDTAVPTVLKTTQQWFASIITRAIDENSQMNPLSPDGRLMEDEACQYIAPSPTLRPAERIQIYNQQYWWRLLSALQDTYPLVTRLFGYYSFNASLAIPFLTKYPSDHWSLTFLGARLPKWIEDEYREKDKELVLNAAKIDWAFNESFVAAELPSIELAALPQGDFSSLLDQPLDVQQHVKLFDLPYDLFQFRTVFLKEEPDYWIEHDFPPLEHCVPDERKYFVLFRTLHNLIAVESIQRSEYLLLNYFLSGGRSVDSACDWLEHSQDANLQADASEKLSEWFQRWVSRKWLAIRDS